ncbi:MAG TPA: hypothetical protein VGN86_06225 [Pyrinomonadaceae bacterium]|jgi:hypothetical protein|nr:hypothetical protein [Pyrinomonadaceae bacterium]
MKQILAVLVLGFALSLCNLTNKLKTSTNSNGPGKTATGSSDTGGDAEQANPSAAQTAALAGGQTVKWDAQGMSWTVPPKWTETTNESKMLLWRSPGGWDAANLIVNISAMDESFPTDISIKAFYDQAKTRMKNGEVDEVKWLEIDGVKGVQFREANPEKEDGIRRLQWMTYRKYAGQVQLVNLMLSSSGKGFPKQQDAMYGVMYSTKLVH